MQRDPASLCLDQLALQVANFVLLFQFFCIVQCQNENVTNLRLKRAITKTHQKISLLPGFAVVLLVIYYLQIGCTPPVLPSLQAINPSHFSTSSSAAVTADKLTSGSLPLFVTTYRSNNNETLGNLLVGFFKFYCDFNWHQVLSVRLAGPRSVPYDKKWTRPYIRIEDPCDLKNVTRAVYKLYQFDSIRQAIRRAKGKLEYDGCRLSEIL